MPSLQTTGPLPLEGEELAAAGVAAPALAAEGALAELPLAAEADLFTPPWPLQAPRPPWGEVVPSLQTTGPLDVPCADETIGTASSAAANTTLKVMPFSLVFVRSIAVIPFELPLRFPGGRIPESPRRRYAAGRSTLGPKLSEDPIR